MHYVHWDARWDEWVARDQLRGPCPRAARAPSRRRRAVRARARPCRARLPASLARHACAPALTVIPRRWLRRRHGRRGRAYCVGDVASSGASGSGATAPHPAQAGPGAPRAAAATPADAQGPRARRRRRRAHCLRPETKGSRERPGATRAGPGAQRDVAARRPEPEAEPDPVVRAAQLDEAVDGRVHLPNQTKVLVVGRPVVAVVFGLGRHEARGLEDLDPLWSFGFWGMCCPMTILPEVGEEQFQPRQRRARARRGRQTAVQDHEDQDDDVRSAQHATNGFEALS